MRASQPQHNQQNKPWSYRRRRNKNAMLRNCRVLQQRLQQQLELLLLLFHLLVLSGSGGWSSMSSERTSANAVAAFVVAFQRQQLHATDTPSSIRRWIIHNGWTVGGFDGYSRGGRNVSRTRMVRNIDLPEVLILYGDEVICDPVVSHSAREGLSALVAECHEVQTKVVAFVPAIPRPTTYDEDEEENDTGVATSPEAAAAAWLETILPVPLARSCVCRPVTAENNSPIQDLLDVMDSLVVQPRPFGGSGGFGSGLAGPPRPPEPRHTVVLTSTVQQTRAARACGMRVISVTASDPLADAVLLEEDNDRIDFGVDDIATPGSYWLNPPHPRDDRGNAVDPYELLAVAAADINMAGETTAGVLDIQQDSTDAKNNNDGGSGGDEMEDNELDAILADLSPL
jgi:hypothetical protein